MCIHLEGITKRAEYPCNDVPSVCGWGPECSYPYCWWGGRIIEGWIMNAPKEDQYLLRHGSNFKAILYKGPNVEIAQTIYSYLKSKKDNGERVVLNGLGAGILFEVIDITTTQAQNPGDDFTIEVEGKLA